jgi:hypothetical protein
MSSSANNLNSFAEDRKPAENHRKFVVDLGNSNAKDWTVAESDLTLLVKVVAVVPKDLSLGSTLFTLRRSFDAPADAVSDTHSSRRCHRVVMASLRTS